jgi:hypothetical protein
MKHILNNLSEEEKNAIREQHTGGMKVITENFSKLINSKLGDSKPLVNEQTTSNPKEMVRQIFNSTKSITPYTGWGSQEWQAIKKAVNGPGTDEDSIVEVFSSLKDKKELSSLIDNFKGTLAGPNGSMGYGLFNILDDEFSDSDWIRILKPLQKLK